MEHRFGLNSESSGKVSVFFTKRKAKISENVWTSDIIQERGELRPPLAATRLNMARRRPSACGGLPPTALSDRPRASARGRNPAGAREAFPRSVCGYPSLLEPNSVLGGLHCHEFYFLSPGAYRIHHGWMAATHVGTASALRLLLWKSCRKPLLTQPEVRLNWRLSLIGVMTLFLGLVKVAEAGGILVIIARLIRPLMVWLFPEVPPNHPATGAMIMNFSANLMGLGNAATPFGIRAMQELEKLNPCPGTATNAMVLFVAINTAGITLFPASVIALRAAAGSANPAAILPTTLFASFCATLFALFATRAYQRFFPLPHSTGQQTGIENNIGNGTGRIQIRASQRSV